MHRPLTPEERRLVAEEQALADIFGETSTAPYHARLRVRTATGERDILLGARTQTTGPTVIVDWQTAPLAAVFLGSRVGDEYEQEHDGRLLTGTVLRRHLVKFRDGAIVEICTDDVTLRRGVDWSAEDSSGPRLHPRSAEQRLRASSPVVLDPTQRRAVELPDDRSLLVLGEAGFGKTTVALHRLARLARTRDNFRALVIVPTPGLQRLVVRTLADLGVTGVAVETFHRWVAAQARRMFPELPRQLGESASEQVRRLKRHPALRTVLAKIVAGTPAMREVRAGYRDTPETIRDLLLHLLGDRELLSEVVDAAALPRATIDEVLAHTRVQFSARTERALAHVDRARLRTLDGLAIDAGTPQQDAGTIDVEDLAVVFALHRRITNSDTTRHAALPQYHHILLDEAQELAPIELELLARAVAPGGTLTIAGDGQQQVDASTSFTGWPDVLAELSRPDAAVVTLTLGHRCPPAIEALARHVLDPSIAPPSDRDILVTRHDNHCHLITALADTLQTLQTEDPQLRIAVVCRHEEVARRVHTQMHRALPARLVLDGEFSFRPGIDVTCVREVKGLEFDLVIVPDADTANYPDAPVARRALYVALTRPLHQLWLASVGPRSPVLPP